MNIKGIELNKEILEMSFDLNSDQQEALNHLADFLESDSVTTYLAGPAGTGKTSITKALLKYVELKYRGLKSMKVILAAPTHKAKMIIQNATGKNAITVHKLVGLRANVSLAEYDATNLIFNMNFDLTLFDSNTLVIIDESSFINDELCDDIVKTVGARAKIIFQGDSKQLPPVKQVEKSKVFSGTDFPGYMLTKIERQDINNPITKTLTTLRERVMYNFESDFDLETQTGLRVTTEPKEFVQLVKKAFSSKESINNPLGTKCLAYTNKRVSELNTLVRKIKGREGNIQVDDLLMAKDGFVSKIDAATLDPTDKGIIEYEVFNMSEYLVLKMTDITINLNYYKVPIPGIRMELYDFVDRECIYIDVMHPDTPKYIKDSYTDTIEQLRLKASTSVGRTRALLFKKWYYLTGSFAVLEDLVYQGRIIRKKTFDFGYAITVHSAQGSTYDEVYIDMHNMLRYDNPELRALQYVALSRTRKSVTLLT